MKITFVVSDLTYPPMEGLHQQSVLLATCLKSSGHEVFLTGFVREPGRLDVEALLREEGLDFQGHRVPSRAPLLLLGILNRLGLGRLVYPRTFRALRDSLVSSDDGIIHLEGVAACGMFRGRFGPAVLSLIDPLSRRRFRLADEASSALGKLNNLTVGVLAFLFEHLVAPRQIPRHVVSDDDAAYMRRYGQPMTMAIPVMRPLRRAREFESNVALDESKARDKHIAVVFADLRQSHMLRAFERLAELGLRSKTSESWKFLILGRIDCSEELSKRLDGLDFLFLPWVDDYMKVISYADAIILPDTVGTGLKNRAIQSLSAGRPTIGTAVAFEGIPVVNGRHALVVDSPENVAGQLDWVLRNAEDATALASEGRELILQTYDSAVVTQQWIKLYQRVLGSAP